MKMYPMSLWESLESSGEIPVRELFDNPSYDIDGASSRLDVPDLINAACRGGWPATLQMNRKSAMLVAKDYVNSVCENDISSIDGKRRNPKTARQIMRSYARNISTLAKKTNILADVTASGDITISIDTYDDYVAALERLFVIQDIDAWYPSIRSRTALRSREIDDGANHLLEIKRLVQEHNKTEKQVPLREPDLLIVLTGGQMAYTRKDGVKVIPRACLKD